MSKKHFLIDVIKQWNTQNIVISKAMQTRFADAMNFNAEFILHQQTNLKTLTESFSPSGRISTSNLAQEAYDYLVDSQQRSILTVDALRKAADDTQKHEQDGGMPFLIYDYQVILKGEDLARPSNYMLLKITPPDGTEIDEYKRPFIIIDPRAGHGPGIGGFKHDSQVGVALKGGHAVYFIAFAQKPLPEQTIADVTSCEAEFVKHVVSLHPQSPKPIVIGNCQGGWASAILAATHPELTGPIVLNGAPMAYWSGKLGQDPMRYSGGLAGGVTPALFSADINNGIFDGANLVLNFEGQNPARTWFKKYYDLYACIDEGSDKFIDFEKWWSTFYFMTDKEIQWIVENLFIGNKLSHHKAELEPGLTIDLRAINAPIIVFASHGDNITPPGQALNWIVDAYPQQKDIEEADQRIIYLVHEDIGHLGIFVSSSVAKKEHNELVSTLETIEAFPPGLYQMHIENKQEQNGELFFDVSFTESNYDELEAITGKRTEEAYFEDVAYSSEQIAKLYQQTMQESVKTLGSMTNLEKKTTLHPSRLARTAFSSDMPLGYMAKQLSVNVEKKRKPTHNNNPFKLMESMLIDNGVFAIDSTVKCKEALSEFAFFNFWGSPVTRLAIRAQSGKQEDQEENTTSTNDEAAHKNFALIVKEAINEVNVGGLNEAIMRLLLLVYKTRGRLNLDTLARCSQVLLNQAPLKNLDAKQRTHLLRKQKIIVDTDISQAIETLPNLLKHSNDMHKARSLLEYVIGAEPSERITMKPEWHAIEDIIQPWLRNAV